MKYRVIRYVDVQTIPVWSHQLWEMTRSTLLEVPSQTIHVIAF